MNTFMLDTRTIEKIPVNDASFLENFEGSLHSFKVGAVDSFNDWTLEDAKMSLNN